MDYALIKTIHQSAVALTAAGFLARGAASLAGAAWVRSRWARSLPHAVDSVLLLSALALAWTLRLNPLVTPWLLAKLVGLLFYIGLGMVALRPGRPWPLRAAAWVAALVTLAFIVSVAITKQPAGFLRLL
jgi:uncharacterized membrane protein SirB2